MVAGCGTNSPVSESPKQRTGTVSHASAPSPALSVPQITSRDGQPSHLVIPAIGLNAFVETVGILSDGDLATPAQNPWVDAGWYNQGVLPGEQGSAVIDGHLDRPGGYPAVFWRLRELHAGQEIQVVDYGGKTLRFRITSIAYYPPGQAPLMNIFGNQGGRFLNLITCAGDWIPDQHQTTLRLVIYSTLE